MRPLHRHFSAIFGIISGIILASKNGKPKWMFSHNDTNQMLKPPFRVPGPQSQCPTTTSSAKSAPIHFIESSGQTCLTGRQACGVESAWRANPEMQIRVHINENKNATPDWDHHFVRPGRVRSCVLNYLLSNLSSNIQLLHADFTRDFLSSSSFWPLRKELEKSSWSTVHLSDAIRLILLQRYGGYYLDFDNIVLRPLHCLNNTLSYLEEAPNIENGIMILDAGHPFLQFLMDFSAKHYERNNRVSLGPPRVGQAFLQFCNTSQFGRFNLPVPTLFSHQPNSPGRILPN